MKKINDTLFEMLLGIIVWGLLVQIVLLVGFKDYLYNAIGLWCGIVVDIGWAIHLKRSIEEVIYYTGEYAEREYRAGAGKRLAFAAILIGVVFYFEWGNPLTLLIGVFSLKIAAYAQPGMHKILQKFQKSK